MTFYNKIFVGYNCISSQIIFSKLPKWQFSKITISAYVNLLRVIDHKIKNPSIRTKHNLLSSNQSKVTTVGYGGGRVSVPSFISSPISATYVFDITLCTASSLHAFTMSQSYDKRYRGHVSTKNYEVRKGLYFSFTNHSRQL